jgi:hypothetical protein
VVDGALVLIGRLLTPWSRVMTTVGMAA